MSLIDKMGFKRADKNECIPHFFKMFQVFSVMNGRFFTTVGIGIAAIGLQPQDVIDHN